MYDFRSFSPLAGERFPAVHTPSMATPVPARMQDCYGRVYRYVGALGEQPLRSGSIVVFPGHVYEAVSDAH